MIPVYLPSQKIKADVAHLVERDLAKVEVAGSSPVIRSKRQRQEAGAVVFGLRLLTAAELFSAWVVVPMAIGMVDTQCGFDRKNKVTHLPGWWSRWLSGW